MRVIAGTAKGRRLKVPPGDRTRPTSDRVKEALFSSLQPELPGASVLDLFAGSGSLGIEALSRGAATVTFVERHDRTARILEENVETCDVGGRATVVTAEVQAALGSPPGAPFDVALLDPPYGMADEELAAVLDSLAPHLAEGAVVTVERDRRSGAPRWPARIGEERQRRYGDTVIHVGRVAAASEPEEAP
ncbi:MAG: 16S rRNA (guanine(966)-N(2))-methyltransferase RsmD [Actinobacteria bacterium]|nr:16S rRNA (guanine(966)-N(2))-methyltransferase RsmD [Actinomycetota bacterium]